MEQSRKTFYGSFHGFTILITIIQDKISQGLAQNNQNIDFRFSEINRLVAIYFLLFQIQTDVRLQRYCDE